MWQERLQEALTGGCRGAGPSRHILSRPIPGSGAWQIDSCFLNGATWNVRLARPHGRHSGRCSIKQQSSSAVRSGSREAICVMRQSVCVPTYIYIYIFIYLYAIYTHIYIYIYMCVLDMRAVARRSNCCDSWTMGPRPSSSCSCQAACCAPGSRDEWILIGKVPLLEQMGTTHHKSHARMSGTAFWTLPLYIFLLIVGYPFIH